MPISPATKTQPARPRRGPLLALIGALVALSLSACGGGSGDAVPPAGPDPAPPVAAPVLVVNPGVWVVLGSSTAAGVGAVPGESWSARLRIAYEPATVEIVNLARSGMLTAQARPLDAPAAVPQPAPLEGRNVDAALARSPRLLVLAYPSNDAGAGVPPRDSLTNLQAVQQRALQGGVATMVLSSQPVDALDPPARERQIELDRLARAAFGPCFVELREALAGPNGGIAPAYASGDGVHLNGEGHRVIAERVRAQLTAGQCVRVVVN
jgi:acyl-CoA thioesterase I